MFVLLELLAIYIADHRLLKWILFSIEVPDSAADERQRTETYNVCKTLDSLKAKVADKGYALSRTELYYR